MFRKSLSALLLTAASQAALTRLYEIKQAVLDDDDL